MEGKSEQDHLQVARRACFYSILLLFSSLYWHMPGKFCVAFAAENIPGSIPQDVALSVCRVLQEGLNNIAKHACSTHVAVTLRGDDDGLNLTVQDDGIGFDAAEVREKPGLGLSSMRERMTLLNRKKAPRSR